MFRCGELGNQNPKYHKLKSHMCKNLLVEEYDKKACYIVFSDSNCSEKVLKGDCGATLVI